jgi:hypothetical protein
MPASRQRSRSLASACAVSAITGRRQAAGGLSCAAGTYALRRLVTIEFRHLAVHEDNIDRGISKSIKRFETVAGERY